ncbi:MAG: hypothetical protein QOF21_595 [Actinomycetota bacterium]|jgi:hypothetical protein
MRLRRTVVGLALVGLIAGGFTARASADPIVPGGPDIPGVPTIGVPDIDPQNPQIPQLPYVPIPEQAMPLTGLLSPAIPPVCTASYLLPLAGIVALTAVFDQAGIDEPPVPPSFINPLFGPVTTACVAVPFPTISSCGPDAQFTAQLNALGAQLPDAGDALGLGTIAPFDTVPAPFASVVIELMSIQTVIETFALGGAASPVNFADAVSDQLGCS